MIWANAYVGVPFQDLGRDVGGCDCWGLARLVYSEVLGIDLPSYAEAYASVTEQAEISCLLAARTRSPWMRTETIRTFDLLLFRRGRADTHIGVAVDDRIMLHMASGDHAKIESLSAPRWAPRLVAAYRHAETPVFSGVK